MSFSTSDLPELTRAMTGRFARLKQKKYRRAEQRYLAEGLRTVAQLCEKLQSGRRPAAGLEALIFGQQLLDDAQTRPGSEPGMLLALAQRAAEEHGIMLYSAGNRMMEKLSDTRQPQGAIAVAQMPEKAAITTWLNELAAPAPEARFLLALDGLADPGNLGTLYRSAAWFDTAGLLLSPACADIYNPKVVRSTAGATGSLPLAEVDLPETLKELHTAGYQVYLLDLDETASSVYEAFEAFFQNRTHHPDSPGVIVVVGNEAHGISAQLRGRYPAVFIPGSGDAVESLNAAVSGSIAMSSFREAGQRIQPQP